MGGASFQYTPTRSRNAPTPHHGHACGGEDRHCGTTFVYFSSRSLITVTFCVWSSVGRDVTVAGPTKQSVHIATEWVDSQVGTDGFGLHENRIPIEIAFLEI